MGHTQVENSPSLASRSFQLVRVGGRCALRKCHTQVRGQNSWGVWRRTAGRGESLDLEGRRWHCPPERMVAEAFAISSLVEWVHNKGNIPLLAGRTEDGCLGSGRCIVLLTPGCSVQWGPLCPCLFHSTAQQSCLFPITSRYSAVNLKKLGSSGRGFSKVETLLSFQKRRGLWLLFASDPQSRA